MNKETALEVLNKIIGPIRPCADAGIDRDRIENLNLYLEVFNEMYLEIDYIMREWKDTPYGSVKPFVNACKNQLKNMDIEVF